jgi:hypothetical protein
MKKSDEEKQLDVTTPIRTKLTKPHTGSVNEWLMTFAVGESRYVETTRDTFDVEMSRLNTAPSRRPESMKGVIITTSLVRCFESLNDIGYFLIRVTRLK